MSDGKMRAKFCSRVGNSRILAAVIIILTLLFTVVLLIQISPSALEKNCNSDSDCVPAACCHPTECINKNYAPDCFGIFCTQVCEGPLDCGAGKCACVNNKCAVEEMR